MKRNDDLAARSRALLNRVVAATEKRDEQLNQVQKLLSDDDAIDQHADYLNDVASMQVNRIHQQGMSLAMEAQGSARRAERAVREVKRLDALHARVKECLDIAQGVEQQQQSLAGVSKALRSGDLEGATDLVVAYEAAAGLCGGIAEPGAENSTVDNGSMDKQPSATTTDDSFDMVNDDPTANLRGKELIDASKRDLLQRLETELVVPNANKDHVFRICRMMARLGKVVDAYESYCGWVAKKCTAEIQEMLGGGMPAIGGNSGSTHLTLVGDVLDHVVATLEREEEAVQSTFGGKSMAKLLLLLHQESTSSSVSLLKDFLDRRTKGAQQREPRLLDQTLEEMSHLVNCCHLYMHFMDQRYREAIASTSDGASAAPEQKSAGFSAPHQKYHYDLTKDVALFDMINELLAIYVPLQQTYFDSAFREAAELEKANEPDEKEGTAETGAGVMNAFSSLYGRSGGSAGSSSNLDDGPIGAGVARPPKVLLVDDVFYFLRVALHRAVGTKSTPIVSAIIISINNAVRDTLVPHVVNELQRRRRENSPWDGSRWVNALFTVATYTQKLADELERVAQESFSGDDMVQFREQKHDLTNTGKTVEQQYVKVTSRVATNVATSMYQASNFPEAFTKANYVMGEEGFNAPDSSQRWLSAAIEAWAPIVNQARAFLDDKPCEDVLLRVTETVVAGFTDAAQGKRFDAFGAMHLDKDVRALRLFFAGYTERPSREKFGGLVALASVLMASSRQEADEAAAMLPDGVQLDVAAVLKLRVDLSAK